MSGVAAQALSHVVRRGLQQIPTGTDGSYDLSRAQDGDVKLDFSIFTMISLIFVAITTIFVIASVDYTVGSVMASLAFVESPSTTTIVETAPPAYSDEPDAPLEKKMDVEDIQDVEVTVIKHKPITASVVGTIKHLHRIGGFTARWRGLGWSFFYHFAVNGIGHVVAEIFTGPLGHIPAKGLGYTLAVILMCRLHMAWTHAMIATPTTTHWSKRIIPRKQCRSLYLASLNYAVAQQSIIVLPVLAFICMPIAFPGFEQASTFQTVALFVQALAIPVVAILAAFFLYLPAAGALARIEACLLPEDRQTIVPFDRMAIVGDLDVEERGTAKKLNAAAWKSFCASDKLRVIKLYVKLVAFQLSVLLVGLHLLGAIVYFSNPDQVIAAIAQLRTFENMPW